VYIRRLDADSSGTVARRQTRRPCRSLYVRQNKHKSGSAQGCQRTALCAKKQRGLIYLGFCTGVDDVATLCDISDPTLFECVQSRAVTSCVPNETVMCVCVYLAVCRESSAHRSTTNFLNGFVFQPACGRLCTVPPPYSNIAHIVVASRCVRCKGMSNSFTSFPAQESLLSRISVIPHICAISKPI